MSTSTPFNIDVPQTIIDEILEKVRAYKWEEMSEIVDASDRWLYGTDMSYMKELCAYWADNYDWRKEETLLNSFPQFIANVEGQDIHFIHVKGSGANPAPLLMTHGWPGSVFEFYGVIERLAHPERFGGDKDDGLTLVMPSLPGYGFSGKPKRPMGPRATAKLWDQLMRGVLGYRNYIAQGGDWGSAVSGWIAHDHSLAKGGGCKALHYNMYGVYGPVAPESDEERAWADNADRIRSREFGYFYLQSTKPQTLSYALMDSPVGVAAWIVEKFNSWSDSRGIDGSEHIENAFSKDQILTNIMIYLVTRTFNTSIWFYRGFRDERSNFMDPGVKIDLPTGIAVFPKELIPFPPRSMVEKHYNIVRWVNFDRGGHFAAMETNELFADEILTFVREVNTGV